MQFLTEQELKYDDQLRAQIKESYPVNFVECYARRTSVEDVIRNGFPSDSKSVTAQLGRRKPWTGFGTWLQLEP